MSMITRCPACGTMFKVVPDQLKVSQGWVRCGQCATVFDASLHLQTTISQPVGWADLSGEFKPVGSSPGLADSPKQDLQGNTRSTFEVAKAKHVQVAVGDLSLTGGPAATAAADGAADVLAHHEVNPNLNPEINPEINPVINHEINHEIYPAIDHVDHAINEAPVDVSFVRDARRQARWRRPVVQVLLACLGLLLIIFLLLQLAVQQRDKLAAFEPKLMPALQTLCAVLTCAVGPTRQIEAIVIDSSSFNKLNDSVYRLTFSIKNTAPSTVAMPSLEVTLTDTQDQAVIRRVLAPAQFGMASGLLGANAEFSGVVAMQLTPPEAPGDAGSVSRLIAGYRLLAFYP